MTRAPVLASLLKESKQEQAIGRHLFSDRRPPNLMSMANDEQEVIRSKDLFQKCGPSSVK